MGLVTTVASCQAVAPQLVDGRPVAGGMSLSELGLILSAAMMVWALFVSGAHLVLHAVHFSNRQEQVRIMRIILTIPIFAILAFLAILLRMKGLYIIPWIDVWTSIALANYFLLLCAYIAPDEQGQVAYFTSGKKNYRHFRWTWILVFQLVPVSFAIAIVQDTTIAIGKFCVATLGSNFAKPYLVFVRLTSILIAVLALLRLADRLRPSLHHQPLRRQLWTFQSLVVGNAILQFTCALLAYFVPPTETLSLVNISITLPMLLLSVGTVFYAVAFLYAFSWRPYALGKTSVEIGRDGQPRRYAGGPCGLVAMGHALNPLDLVHSLYRTTQLLFYRRMPAVMTPKYMRLSGASTPRSYHTTRQASPRSQSPYAGTRPMGSPYTGYTSPASSHAPGTNRSLYPIVSPLHHHHHIPRGHPNLDKSLPLPPPTPVEMSSPVYGAELESHQRSASQRSAYVPVHLVVSPLSATTTTTTPPWPLGRGGGGLAYHPLEPLAELPPKSPPPVLELEVPLPVRIAADGTEAYGFSPLGDQIHDFIDEYRMTMYHQQHRF